MKMILKKVRAKLKTLPFAKTFIMSPYYKLRTSSLLTDFLDRESKKFYLKNPPQLAGLTKNIVEELKRDGIAISRLESLFPGGDLLKTLRQYTKTVLKDAATGRKKTFLEYIWQEGVWLDLENPFFKFSLEPKVLDIINSYLESASKFKFSSLAQTRPMASGEEAKGSQRWHRDPGIRKLCKIFIYLTDVADEGAGPFIYIKGSHLSGLPAGKAGKRGKIFPQELYGREGIYPPEGEVEKIVPKEDIKVCLGKAGTVIFCDTIGLHKGGYSTKKERIMYTALYERPSAFGKAKFKYPSDFKNQIKNLDLPVQYALKP